MNEAQQQIRSAPKSRKPEVYELTYLLPILGRRIHQAFLNIAMAVFFGVKLRGILRQGLDNNFRMFKEVAEGGFARMNGRLIANQNEAFRHEAA